MLNGPEMPGLLEEEVKLSWLALLLCAIVGCHTRPKQVTVALNGSHGISWLERDCIGLQADYDRFEKMPLKTQLALMHLSEKNHIPCLRKPDELNRQAEDQLMTAFASNPACAGVTVYQGFFGIKDSTQESMARFSTAGWHLDLNLNVSGNTGDLSLKDSEWVIHPTELSGALSDLDKAATQICSIAKREGAEPKSTY